MNVHIGNPTLTNHVRALRFFRWGSGLLFGLVGLMFAILTLLVVPAPGAGTAFEVSGRLVSLSYPHPVSGDVNIQLGDGRRYYINRVNQAPVDWEKMLLAAQPGSEVRLTAVIPLARRLVGGGTQTGLPVAGLQIDDVVYLDPAIAAVTWTAQARFRRIAGILLLGSALCFLPEFRQTFK